MPKELNTLSKQIYIEKNTISKHIIPKIVIATVCIVFLVLTICISSISAIDIEKDVRLKCNEEHFNKSGTIRIPGDDFFDITLQFYSELDDRNVYIIDDKVKISFEKEIIQAKDGQSERLSYFIESLVPFKEDETIFGNLTVFYNYSYRGLEVEINIDTSPKIEPVSTQPLFFPSTNRKTIALIPVKEVCCFKDSFKRMDSDYEMTLFFTEPKKFDISPCAVSYIPFSLVTPEDFFIEIMMGYGGYKQYSGELSLHFDKSDAIRQQVKLGVSKPKLSISPLTVFTDTSCGKPFSGKITIEELGYNDAGGEIRVDGLLKDKIAIMPQSFSVTANGSTEVDFTIDTTGLKNGQHTSTINIPLLPLTNVSYMKFETVAVSVNISSGSLSSDPEVINFGQLQCNDVLSQKILISEIDGGCLRNVTLSTTDDIVFVSPSQSINELGSYGEFVIDVGVQIPIQPNNLPAKHAVIIYEGEEERLRIPVTYSLPQIDFSQEPDTEEALCACVGGTFTGSQCCGDDWEETWCSDTGGCIKGKWVEGDGDDAKSVCLHCFNGTWVEELCCGDDTDETWCAKTGYCSHGVWKENNDSVYCTFCKNNYWINGKCSSMPPKTTPVSTPSPTVEKIKVTTVVVEQDDSNDFPFELFTIVLFLNLAVVFSVEKRRNREKYIYEHQKMEVEKLKDALDNYGVPEKIEKESTFSLTPVQLLDLSRRRTVFFDIYEHHEIKPYPVPPEIYNRLGVVSASGHHYDDANDYFDMALDVDPHNVIALSNKAIIIEKKAWKSKIQAWQDHQVEWQETTIPTFWTNTPQQWGTIISKWRLPEKTKRLYEQEIDYLKKIVIIDPENADALYRLGKAYYLKEDLENAKTALEDSVSLNPSNGDALHTLAEICGRLGLHAQEQEYYRRGKTVSRKRFKNLTKEFDQSEE